MSSECGYDRLWGIVVMQKLSNNGSCLVTAHHGHVAVHEDYVEAAFVNSIFLVVFEVGDHHLNGLVAVVGLSAGEVGVDVEQVSQNDV